MSGVEAGKFRHWRRVHPVPTPEMNSCPGRDWSATSGADTGKSPRVCLQCRILEKPNFCEIGENFVGVNCLVGFLSSSQYCSIKGFCQNIVFLYFPEIVERHFLLKIKKSWGMY